MAPEPLQVFKAEELCVSQLKQRFGTHFSAFLVAKRIEVTLSPSCFAISWAMRAHRQRFPQANEEPCLKTLT